MKNGTSILKSRHFYDKSIRFVTKSISFLLITCGYTPQRPNCTWPSPLLLFCFLLYSYFHGPSLYVLHENFFLWLSYLEVKKAVIRVVRKCSLFDDRETKINYLVVSPFFWVVGWHAVSCLSRSGSLLPPSFLL